MDETDSFAAENFAELKQHRVLSAGVPAEFGGGGASYRELAEFLRILAHHCSSTALTLSMHTHTVARVVWTWKHMHAPVTPLLQRLATEQLMLVSTGGNDWLESLGIAEKASGGFRIRARKPFASGGPAGDALATSAVYNDPEAGPTVLHFFVPVRAEGVRIMSNWRTVGMRATGSDDMMFEDVFVPEEAVQARRPKGVWHPAIHLAGLIAFPLVHSVYLGVAESVRDIAIGLVSAEKRREPPVQLMAGEMENRYMAARLAVQRMVEPRRCREKKRPTRSSRRAPWQPKPHCPASIGQWNWPAARLSTVLQDWSGACVTYRRRAIIPCAPRINSCLPNAWRWVCRSNGGCDRQPLPGAHVQPSTLIRRALAHIAVRV